MKTRISIIAISIVVMIFAGCKKNKDFSGVTYKIRNENLTVRAASAHLTADYSYPGKMKAIVVNISEDENLSNSMVFNATIKGKSFEISVTGLQPLTKYFYRIDSDTGYGVCYGEQKSFTTLQSGTATVPSVTTSSVSNITQTSATCGGNVTSDGGATVTARGVCWSTSSNPTTSDSHTTNGSGTGTFTSSITGLSANTTYYVRAYATNSAGTSYGEQKSFTTYSGGGGTHAYVDLGLPSGTLWATCNVGATNPEDYGSYFAWGETSPKSNYDWSTYQWCNGSETTLTKYCTQSSCGYNGFVDNKTVLEPADDAAHVNWGGDWRMPTFDELVELKNNCTWQWTTQGGKNGYRVTGSNNNSIFLPAAGYYDGSGLDNAGSLGLFWSSSLLASNPNRAYYMYFLSGNFSMFNDNRYYGLSVRPVCQLQK